MALRAARISNQGFNVSLDNDRRHERGSDWIGIIHTPVASSDHGSASIMAIHRSLHQRGRFLFLTTIAASMSTNDSSRMM
jgi:hypothetical protein